MLDYNDKSATNERKVKTYPPEYPFYTHNTYDFLKVAEKKTHTHTQIIRFMWKQHLFKGRFLWRL